MNENDSKAEKPQLNPLRLSSASGDEHFDIENETLIGREVECTITLPSPHVSRYHAKINVSDAGLVIQDLNSANGTFVNGKRITEKTPISLGDEIRFDDLAYRLTSEDSGQSEATVVMSNKAVLDALKTANTSSGAVSKSSEPSTPSTITPEPGPESNAEDDGTRVLSHDQLRQAASVHQKSQSFTDFGSGPRFIATTAPIRGQVFKLAEQGTNGAWRLGRSRECEICVAVPSVSRVHAVITKEDGRFHIKAENEAKPFMFNNMPQSSAMLKHNDHLQIGSIELIFRLDESSSGGQRQVVEEKAKLPLKTITIAAVVFVIAVILTLILINSPKDDKLPKLKSTTKPPSVELDQPPEKKEHSSE